MSTQQTNLWLAVSNNWGPRKVFMGVRLMGVTSTQTDFYYREFLTVIHKRTGEDHTTFFLLHDEWFYYAESMAGSQAPRLETLWREEELSLSWLRPLLFTPLLLIFSYLALILRGVPRRQTLVELIISGSSSSLGDLHFCATIRGSKTQYTLHKDSWRYSF